MRGLYRRCCIMIKTKTWIAVFAGLLVICLGLSLWIFLKPTGKTIANVYMDGECIRSVDLSAVTEPYTFTVTSHRGTNVVKVEKGRIRVIEADCPDKVCVRSGWISDSAAPVCCLPHKLVIRIEKNAMIEEGPDAVSE